jgi:hypothetical protein
LKGYFSLGKPDRVEESIGGVAQALTKRWRAFIARHDHGDLIWTLGDPLPFATI